MLAGVGNMSAPAQASARAAIVPTARTNGPRLVYFAFVRTKANPTQQVTSLLLILPRGTRINRPLISVPSPGGPSPKAHGSGIHPPTAEQSAFTKAGSTLTELTDMLKIGARGGLANPVVTVVRASFIR